MQFDNKVIDFSSQYGGSGWSARQALGPIDSIIYGHFSSACSPAPQNGSLEFLAVGYGYPVFRPG
jgi:hypothetical protein